jgi:hypothetical protein
MIFKGSISSFAAFIFLISTLFSNFAIAGIEIGSGNSSMTGGRYVPSIDLAYLHDNNVFAWSGTGVKSGYYYQSSHQLSYFKSWKAGDMWGGDVNSGFGGSVAYTTRAFQDEGSTLEQKDSDFLLGPAIRMNLSYGFFYINMSATFGIRNVLTHAMSLTFQDVESLSVGVRF